MKRLIYIALALFFYACGNKPDNNVRTLDDSFVLMKEYIEDPASSFEEYQPIFEEILDSLQDVVLNDPDANSRFIARTLPTYMLTHICNSERVNKGDSILNLYNQRRRDILYTWYVQQLVDTADNSPFIILSYAAPYDTNGNDTRVSFTFSENCNPESDPVLIVVLPVKTENPLILFSEWGEDGKEYSSDSYVLANNNIMVYADSCQTHIMLMGKFLNDMLEYQQMNVCYIREDAPDYKTVENDIYKQYVTAIPVDLYKFQEQYRAAHKWMEDNQ
jgi:hypothetical protein